jgi:hypothetical protein
MILLKLKGKLHFEPQNKTKKHNEQSSWKRVAMIIIKDDTCEYYAWFIKRRYNLELNKPLRGTHITIINDRNSEAIDFDKVKESWEGKEIEFYIDPTPRTNGEHWWLRVWSSDAEDIRVKCGLKAKPYFDFHLTIGYANPRWIEHAKYIHECIKRFEPGEPRKDFKDYQIWKD